MPHIEDWEFGSLFDSACQSLSELRIRQVSGTLSRLLMCFVDSHIAGCVGLIDSFRCLNEITVPIAGGVQPMVSRYIIFSSFERARAFSPVGFVRYANFSVAL